MIDNHSFSSSRSYKQAFVLSFIIALMMAIFSLGGILFQSSIYPSVDLQRSFIANDVVNLMIGLPILLVSMWLHRRKQLVGLLLWPGALFYVVYNYSAYASAAWSTWLFPTYLMLAVLSVYTIVVLLSGIDAVSIRQRLCKAAPDRFPALVLTGFGALFFVRSVFFVFNAIYSHTSLPVGEMATLLADFLTTPAWIIGGIWLLQRKAWGYTVALGLLFQASMLFIALLVYFLLLPIMMHQSFSAADFVVTFIMGLLCFIPFGLFLRGVLSIQRGT